MYRWNNRLIMSFGFFNMGLGFGYGMNWFMPNLAYNNFYTTNCFSSNNPFSISNCNIQPYFNDFSFNTAQTNIWNSNPFSITFGETNNFTADPFSFFNSSNTSISFSASDSISNLSSTKKASSSTIKKDDSDSNENKSVTKGYNSQKGQALANAVLAGIPSYRPKPLCAKYVKSAIANTGLGIYKAGHAYNMFEILDNNTNFKEISPDEIDVEDLPAGCVLVYDKGVEGYSEEYGHTEITLGDGRAASDFIQEVYKKPSAIYMPV